MAATNSDLFLLMFNLSLINDMAQIKRIYVESMNYTYKQLQFSINSPVNEIDENERIPIVNGESDFGTLLIKGDLNLIDSVELSYIRNSVGLLAVILQNRTFAQTLTREKISLEERAKDREFQIRLSLEEIRRLKNTLSNVIDSMPSILIGVDENNEVTHWNSQAENFYKIKTHDALGRQLLKVVPFLEKQIEDIYEVINNKKIKKHDEIFKNPEGEIHNMETTIYPLLDTEHGGAVIRIDDITEKIRMEEMMVQSEKMMSVGGLSAGMAHEINNPLAGIIQTANVMNSRLSKNMDIPPSKKAAEEAEFFPKR
jgi:PAS domain S-box-containing protein